MFGALGDRRRDHSFDVHDQFGQIVAQLHPSLDNATHSLHLRQPDGALQLGHTIVGRQEGIGSRAPTRLSRPALVAEEPHALRPVLSTGDRDAAVAGGHVLGLLQAKSGDVAPGAQVASLVAGHVCLAAVLDQREVVPLGDVDHGLHVAGVAKEVDDHDRCRAIRDLVLYVRRVHVVRLVHVGENGDAVLVDDRHHRSAVRDRSGDDLVAGVGIDRAYGDVYGGRARGRGHGVLRTI